MKLKLHLKQWLIIGLLLVGLGLVAAPVLAAGGLPDRNPPPANKSNNDDSGSGGPAGAAIELVAPAHPGAWSVVQWQDINGNWQDVDGWRGSLNEAGSRRWWVAAKDLGTGPFRWVVGEAVSEPFNLPVVGAETRVITLPAE
jgi:hypothetical protein